MNDRKAVIAIRTVARRLMLTLFPSTNPERYAREFLGQEPRQIFSEIYRKKL